MVPGLDQLLRSDRVQKVGKVQADHELMIMLLLFGRLLHVLTFVCKPLGFRPGSGQRHHLRHLANKYELI